MDEVKNVIFQTNGYRSKYIFKSFGGFLMGFSLLGLLISIVAVQQIKHQINYTQHILTASIITGVVFAFGIALIIYSYVPSKSAKITHLILKEDNFTIYYKKKLIDLRYEEIKKIKYDMQDPNRVSKYRYTHGDLRIRTKNDKYYIVKCLDAQNAKKHIDYILSQKGILIDSRID